MGRTTRLTGRASWLSRAARSPVDRTQILPKGASLGNGSQSAGTSHGAPRRTAGLLSSGPLPLDGFQGLPGRDRWVTGLGRAHFILC